MSTQLSFEEWEVKLQEVVKANNHLRSRIKMCTTQVGLFFLVTTTVLAQLIVSGILEADTFGQGASWGSLVSPCGFYMLLGVLPNDSKIIRALNLFLAVVWGLFALNGSWFGISNLFVGRHTDRGYDGEDVSEHSCGSDLPAVGCSVQLCNNFLNNIATFVCFFYTLKNVKRIDGASWYIRKDEKGFRFKDAAFKVPGRTALGMEITRPLLQSRKLFLPIV